MAPDLTIEMPLLLWARLVRDLGRRGQGRRESGAFLLGSQSGTRAKIRQYVCYDDIDPNAYQGGAIMFHANGYAALWQRCKAAKLDLIADIHTHPGTNVSQSGIDQRHPMVPVVGHTAMIMPHFGRTSRWSLSGVGVYEYLGNFKWRTHGADTAPRVRLSWW